MTFDIEEFLPFLFQRMRDHQSPPDRSWYVDRHLVDVDREELEKVIGDALLVYLDAVTPPPGGKDVAPA